jgi:hypothetical protein
MEGNLITVQFPAKFDAAMKVALSEILDVKLICETSFSYHRAEYRQWSIAGEIFSLFDLIKAIGKYRVPGIEFKSFEPQVIFHKD